MIVTYPPSSFETVVAGLLEKYGSPTSKYDEPLQNRMGATFRNEVMNWTDDAGNVLRVSRYISADRGGFLLISKQGLDDLDRKAERGKRDI